MLAAASLGLQREAFLLFSSFLPTAKTLAKGRSVEREMERDLNFFSLVIINVSHKEGFFFLLFFLLFEAIKTWFSSNRDLTPAFPPLTNGFPPNIYSELEKATFLLGACSRQVID